MAGFGKKRRLPLPCSSTSVPGLRDGVKPPNYARLGFWPWIKPGRDPKWGPPPDALALLMLGGGGIILGFSFFFFFLVSKFPKGFEISGVVLKDYETRGNPKSLEQCGFCPNPPF